MKNEETGCFPMALGFDGHYVVSACPPSLCALWEYHC